VRLIRRYYGWVVHGYSAPLRRNRWFLVAALLSGAVLVADLVSRDWLNVLVVCLGLYVYLIGIVAATVRAAADGWFGRE
jgi:hypothetical protein